jgi:hypothetical protein
MGQQGRFLLNKSGYSMPWKFNIVNKNNNILFKSLMVSFLLEFLIKNSFFTLFLKKKKNFLKKNNFFQHDFEVIYSTFKTLKKMFKQIFTSQVSISYYNSWYIIRIIIFSLYKKKNIKDNYVNESFFRIRYLYSSIIFNYNSF